MTAPDPLVVPAAPLAGDSDVAAVAPAAQGAHTLARSPWRRPLGVIGLVVIVLWVLIAIAAPIAEEICFRGMLFGACGSGCRESPRP